MLASDLEKKKKKKLHAIRGSEKCSSPMDDKRCADPPYENHNNKGERKKKTIVKLFVHHLRPLIRKQCVLWRKRTHTHMHTSTGATKWRKSYFNRKILKRRIYSLHGVRKHETDRQTSFNRSDRIYHLINENSSA